MLTPEERSMRGRIGGFAQKARYPDAAALTANARATARTNLDGRLCEQYGIEPGSVDFDRRLAAARQAYYTALAFKAAKARRRKRERGR